MATAPLSQLSDYELVNNEQDIRGWQVLDRDGAALGAVTDFIIDTDAERVSHLVLDSDRRIDVRDVTIGDRHVQVTSDPATTTSRLAATQEPGQVQPPKREESVRLPVMEQELRVGKREVVRGAVRIHTTIEERPVAEAVMLREEQVVVKRRAMNLPVGPDFIDRMSKDAVEVVASAEVPVVDKVARVVEEVRVRKDIEEHVETVHETLRRTDVAVEQLPSSKSPRQS